MKYTQINNVTCQRIVLSSQGGWKWQQPYQIATYGQRLTKDGRTIWFSLWQSGKMSWSQIKRFGYADIPKGSLHNHEVK